MQYHCFKLVEQLERKHDVKKLIFLSNYPKVFFLLLVSIRVFIHLKRNPKTATIYVNDGLMALFLTPLIFFTKKPIIVTIHGLDISFPFGPYTWWIRNILSKVDGIIAVSEPTRDLCIKKGIPAEKVYLVKNAVDLSLSKTEKSPDFAKTLERKHHVSLKNKFILMSLGRGVPRKGHLWFTENVIPQLPENFIYFIICPIFPAGQFFVFIEKLLPRAIYRRICMMIGAELDAFHLPHRIHALNLSKRVFFMPQFARDREAIFQLMQIANLFIMPNIKMKDDFEGFGLVALEASGSGLVTLAGKVDGIPSAVHHEKNGFTLEERNVKQWTEKIQELAGKDLSEMSKGFQDYTLSMQYSWEEMASEYIRVFKELQIIKSNNS